MDLEQALAEIARLKGEATKVADTNKTALTEALKKAKEESDKALQVSYNKGFDKAKNASEEDKKNGYVSKEDVDKLLADRDTAFSRQSALRDLGIKNPKKAMKLIDEDDLASLGSEDFKSEDFVKKYGEDIVFTKQGENNQQQQRQQHTKNNEQQKEGLTAEKYEAMSTEERAKVSTADKLALL